MNSNNPANVTVGEEMYWPGSRLTVSATVTVTRVARKFFFVSRGREEIKVTLIPSRNNPMTFEAPNEYGSTCVWPTREAYEEAQVLDKAWVQWERASRNARFKRNPLIAAKRLDEIRLELFPEEQS